MQFEFIHLRCQRKTVKHAPSHRKCLISEQITTQAGVSSADMKRVPGKLVDNFARIKHKKVAHCKETIYLANANNQIIYL